MTIELLLEISANELEKMTDAQLLEFFAPYLIHVRPETGSIKREVSSRLSSNSKTSINSSIDANIAKAKSIALKYGIDLDNL